MGEVFKSFADLALKLEQPRQAEHAVGSDSEASQKRLSVSEHKRVVSLRTAEPSDEPATPTLNLRFEELVAREAAVDLKEKELADRESKLRYADAALRARLINLGDVKSQIDKLVTERRMLEANINAYRAEGIRRVDLEMEERRAEAERELAEIASRRDALERECGAVVANKREVQTMRQFLLRRETEIEKEDAELTEWRAELTDFHKELLRLEKSLKPRDARLKEREKKIGAAEERHATARRKLREMASALDECLELRRKSERKAAAAQRAASKARVAQKRADDGPHWSPARDNLRESLVFNSDGMALESPIHRMGYLAGISGVSQQRRRKILGAAWSGNLPSVHSSSYMAEWGKPVSRRRLARIAHHLAWLIRFNGAKASMEEAVADWTADLKWLKGAYYEVGMNFSWPKI